MNGRIDVLVVDDEPVVRDAVSRVLEAAGFSVATAPDAETALVSAAAASCRMVLCDLMLPGESGLTLLRQLHARRPEVPIAMITGYATPANAEAVREAGAAAFLPKPFDEDELLTLVRHALAQTDVAGEEPRP